MKDCKAAKIGVTEVVEEHIVYDRLYAAKLVQAGDRKAEGLRGGQRRRLGARGVLRPAGAQSGGYELSVGPNWSRKPAADGFCRS